MKQFRILVNGRTCGCWTDCSGVTVEQMETLKLRLSVFYGDKWELEYREV